MDQLIDIKIIENIVNKYGINVDMIGNVIDSSKGKEDKRYTYPINNKYVVKVTNSKMVTEEYMSPIQKLIERYREIGVYAPKVIVKDNGCVVDVFIYDNQEWKAYIEEYMKYHVCTDSDTLDYELKAKMLAHVGKLAAKFSNMPLCTHYSMWTIIHLHAMDEDIDEKEENLNDLCREMEKYEFYDIANRIRVKNAACRNKIREYLDELPTCTYQGDLNPSNILVDCNNEFKGVIDFNMYGEEVNINCFINECMYFLESIDFEELSGKQIFEKMNLVSNKLLQGIFENYTLSKVEKMLFIDYKMITYLSFYPNVKVMIELLKSKSEKILELVDNILKMDDKPIK